MIVGLSKTQTENTDNRVNQSKFKANTRNRFAKGNYEVWENTCDQVTVGDHCSAETRVTDHGTNQNSKKIQAAGNKRRGKTRATNLRQVVIGLALFRSD